MVFEFCGMPLDHENLQSELSYRTSRSSGSGGQNVNKVETRVEVIFCVEESAVLTEEQKKLICSRLKNRIDKKGNLTVSSSTSRQQKQNRKLATERMFSLLELSLKKKKIRKKTGIPKGVQEKRLKKKKQRSEIKSNRSFKPDL